MSYHEIQHNLIAAGYHEGAPISADAIDRAVAESQVCPTCGNDLTYRPWMKLTGQRNAWTGWPETSYRAFAVCEHCDSAEEF